MSGRAQGAHLAPVMLAVASAAAMITYKAWSTDLLVDPVFAVYDLGGIAGAGLLYGLVYATWRGMRNTVWLFGVLFVAIYAAFLVWQTYYAILTVSRTRWGTRATTAFAPQTRGSDGSRPEVLVAPLVSVSRRVVPEARAAQHAANRGARSTKP